MEAAQSNTRLKLLIVCVAFVSLAVPTALATGPQASANYRITAESIDGGGQRATSAHYTADGSLGAGGFVTSADYLHRGGFIGQLNNAPIGTNYILTVAENSTNSIAISALLDTVISPDGEALSFINAANPSAQSGTVESLGAWLLYQPAADFVGADSISWVVQDVEGDRSTGTILVQVVAPPTAPTLNLISITFDPAPGSAAATLSFSSPPGGPYQVQYTDSLTPPIQWTTLGTATITNGTFQIVDPTARNVSQRFYRTIVVFP